jgi:peptide/nickel transport system substrate-binding protein
MRAKRTMIAMAVLLILVTTLAACAPVQQAAAPAQAPAATQAAPQVTNTSVAQSQPSGAKRTLRYGASGDIISLDAQKAQTGSDMPNTDWVYCRLTWYDKTMMQPVPQLAESWKISDDGLTYTFKIREGVKFHNGRDVTAEDVVYSWQRAIDLKDKGRAAGELKDVVSFTATGQYEFTVKLKQQSAVFLAATAHWSLGMVPKEADAQMDTHPVSCGAYQFVEWLPNDHAKYEKFADYWDKAALAKYPDEIILQPIKEEQTRLNMLKTGAIDVMDSVSARNRADVQATSGLKLVQQDLTAAYTVVAFNTQKEPTNNVKLRQALAYAIDKETILKNVFFGAGEVDCSFIPKGHWAYTPVDCPAYDPEKAKALLKEAGLEGINLTLRPGLDAPEEQLMFEIIQQNLQDVGINAKIEMLESGAWFDQVWFGHDYQVTDGWFTREPDPDALMQSVLRKGGGNNVMQFFDQKVEDLFDQGKSTLDPEKRKAIYKQITDILLDQVPAIKITSLRMAMATNDKVTGLFVSPKGFPQWYMLEMK